MTVQRFELLDIFLSAYEAGRDRRAALERGDASDSPEALDALGQQLKAQVETAGENPRDRSENFHSALGRTRYALTALLDEQLIHNTDWPGKSRWADHLLEQRIYRSSLAGRGLFAAIESLSGEHWEPELTRQVALVYLMVLQLGFRGELRGEEECLTPYFRHLEAMISGSEGSAAPTRACPQAYAHNIAPATAERLAPLALWGKRMLLLSGLYLLASSAVWLAALIGFRNLPGH